MLFLSLSKFSAVKMIAIRFESGLHFESTVNAQLLSVTLLNSAEYTLYCVGPAVTATIRSHASHVQRSSASIYEQCRFRGVRVVFILHLSL